MSTVHSSDETALDEWHRIILQHDWDSLPNLLTDDVTYHNPAQSEPLRGKDALVGTLKLVFGIFEDFAYTRRFGGDDGYALEFSGRVGDAPFTGIDLIRFDAAGRITDLVVMIRPIGAVMKLGEEAALRVAQAQAGGE
ncbi:nuclear transport factor 2 family protein [Rhizobium sp. LEGMi12c]